MKRIIKYLMHNKYYRRLIVRAFEDAAILLVIISGIWLICSATSILFDLWGVLCSIV